MFLKMKLMSHNCKLDVGSESMLPPNCRYRRLRKLGQISPYHPETHYHYRSYPVVLAERQRNLLEEGFHMIHPLSLFSLGWMSFMIFVDIAHIMIASYRLIFVIVPLEDLQPHFLDYVLLSLHIICMIDIVVKLNTGYIGHSLGDIVMNRGLVARHYIRRWFIFDLMSCVPVAFVLLYSRHRPPSHIFFAHLLAFARFTRIPTVVSSLRIFMKLFTKVYYWHETMRLVVLFIISVHFGACLQFLSQISNYYLIAKKPTIRYRVIYTIIEENLMDHDQYTLYSKSILTSLAAFFGTGYATFQAYTTWETVTQAFVIIYASLFMIYVIAFSIKLYLTINGSTIKYHELISQVEAYMRLKQFPKSLKRRVRAFYQYRYQNKYIGDEDTSKFLSTDLATEIRLYTRRRLVDKTRLFDGVPVDVVGSVLGCLSPEIYLAEDLVIKAGDIGECMYFIATGTVAVYSLKGIEVCHLEDGAHFGEVALLMSDRKRVATVVAVEITTLYRLDAKDFSEHVSGNAILYERLEQLASRRMHETLLLDEEFQRDVAQTRDTPREGTSNTAK